MTPDVNVLVAAARTDHVHHPVAAPWLRSTLGGAAAVTGLRLMPMVVASFLRLVTNPKVFAAATTPQGAIAYIDGLLELPGVELGALGPEWPLMRQLCLNKQLTGNALPDAWLAATVMQQGEHLVTFDSDFRKLLPRNRLTVLATS